MMWLVMWDGRKRKIKLKARCPTPGEVNLQDPVFSGAFSAVYPGSLNLLIHSASAWLLLGLTAHRPRVLALWTQGLAVQK